MRVYRDGNVAETDCIELNDIWYCPVHNKFAKACGPNTIYGAIHTGIIYWNEPCDWGEGLPEYAKQALREEPVDVHG